MDIKDIKQTEVQEIRDFVDHLDEYGHVYHYPPEKLDLPFRKIMEGMAEIRKLMDDSWEM